MTPEEAKEKWCPFIQFTGAGAGSHEHGGNYEWATNRGASYSKEAFNCCADACMAWRWSETREEKVRADAAFKRDNERLRFGHCGLAGRPE